tara:strand:+ start:682 stop:966 length:285 start_codon:yes stop_codon:yes gene_type:complete
MLHNYLLRKEKIRLRGLVDKRARTSCIIAAEQAALKQEALRGLGTGEGLLLSFAAGCVASITVKHGGKALSLRHFPLSQVLALLSLFGQLKGSK